MPSGKVREQPSISQQKLVRQFGSLADQMSSASTVTSWATPPRTARRELRSKAPKEHSSVDSVVAPSDVRQRSARHLKQSVLDATSLATSRSVAMPSREPR